MFSLSSISSSSAFSLLKNTSIYENFESRVFLKIKFLGEIFHNKLNDLSEKNLHKTIESFWEPLLTLSQCTNSTSVICNWGAFSPFHFDLFYF